MQIQGLTLYFYSHVTALKRVLCCSVVALSSCRVGELQDSPDMKQVRTVYSDCIKMENPHSVWDARDTLAVYSALTDEGKKFWDAYSNTTKKYGARTAKAQLSHMISESGVSYLLTSPFGRSSFSDRELYDMIRDEAKSAFWKYYVERPNTFERFKGLRNVEIMR